MSGPFKMKGWSGLQKSSAIRQPKNLKTSLANIQKSISNTLKGVGTNIRKHVKPQSESSGFGLTSLEKAQAKKLGLSEYQWKTGVGVSGTTRHKKRMWEKKHAPEEKEKSWYGEGIKTDQEGELIKPQEISIVTDGKVTETLSTSSRPEGIGPVTEEFDPGAKKSTPTAIDYGEGFNWKDWSQESTGEHPTTGEPWNLHTLVRYRDEDIVSTYGKDSQEWRDIQKIINKAHRER